MFIIDVIISSSLIIPSTDLLKVYSIICRFKTNAVSYFSFWRISKVSKGLLKSRVCCSVNQEDDDLPYEEEIIRNPYSVKCWMRYIEFKQNGTKATLNMIYERALKELPGR